MSLREEVRLLHASNHCRISRERARARTRARARERERERERGEEREEKERGRPRVGPCLHLPSPFQSRADGACAPNHALAQLARIKCAYAAVVQENASLRRLLYEARQRSEYRPSNRPPVTAASVPMQPSSHAQWHGAVVSGAPQSAENSRSASLCSIHSSVELPLHSQRSPYGPPPGAMASHELHLQQQQQHQRQATSQQAAAPPPTTAVQAYGRQPSDGTRDPELASYDLTRVEGAVESAMQRLRGAAVSRREACSRSRQSDQSLPPGAEALIALASPTPSPHPSSTSHSNSQPISPGLVPHIPAIEMRRRQSFGMVGSEGSQRPQNFGLPGIAMSRGPSFTSSGGAACDESIADPHTAPHAFASHSHLRSIATSSIHGPAPLHAHPRSQF
jgi:hypothetical protein